MLCVCAVQKVGEKVTPIAPRTHGGATPVHTSTHDHPTHISHGHAFPPNLHRRAAAPSGSSPSASTGSSCWVRRRNCRSRWASAAPAAPPSADRGCSGASALARAASCAGSADDPCRLRLCFVPQTARSAALPPLFAARLAGLPRSTRRPRRDMAALLEVRAPATLTQRCTRCVSPTRASGARSRRAAVGDAAVATAAVRARRLRPRRRRRGGGGGGGGGERPARRGRRLARALRHFCAYHDVALRPSVREHLRAQLSTSGGKQATLELSQLLRLPHTSPPPYVDLTPRRLSAHLDGTMQAPPRQPLASVPEVRAVAAAMSCCGGVASVHAVDVRLSEDCVTALGEALRYSPASPPSPSTTCFRTPRRRAPRSAC